MIYLHTTPRPPPLPSPPWGTQEPIKCMRGPQPLNRNMYHMTVVISGACQFANDSRLTMTDATASCFSSARTEQFCLQLCTSHLCWPKNTAKTKQKQKHLESLHSTDSSVSTVEQSLIARCGERRCRGGGRGGATTPVEVLQTPHGATESSPAWLFGATLTNDNTAGVSLIVVCGVGWGWGVGEKQEHCNNVTDPDLALGWGWGLGWGSGGSN